MTRKGASFGERIASLVPFGLTHQKPRHFREMLRVLWENRDNLAYGWRVLSQGVCDGCALGTTGLRDWTVDGTHLCMVRLSLLRLNTMGPADLAPFADVAALRSRSSRELRELGRLAWPLRRRRGEPGFTRVSFEEAWREIGERWRGLDPTRVGLYVTSRGITNEVYYTAQKVMRFLGSNNVDNSARLCHSPSTAGLKSTVGVGATTCSYRDWFEADLIVFLGSNPANDQPVAMKYLYEAKQRGARVVSINAYREPGLERYWVPSNPDSALFGTRFADQHVAVRVGEDLALFTALSKRVLERGGARADFIQAATSGFDAYARALEAHDVPPLLEQAGVDRTSFDELVERVLASDRGILVWSMGITQHARGAETVKAIANLALLREWIGRPGTGLMPIRGHSGVQGGAEMGAYATALPGGVAIDAASAARFTALWGFEVPKRPGLTTVEQFEAAGRGELDGLYCIGGNFLETLPEPRRVEAALSKIGLRVHTDIVASSQMLVEPQDVVFVLPARTRYEQADGGTETSTERRVIFSPEIGGHPIGEARSEWELLLQFAEAVRPGARARLALDGGRRIRQDIARAVPFYAGIERLEKRGDQFQWGGPRLCTERRFPTDDGRARFQIVEPRSSARDPRTFRLATRRGKQFNSMVQREVDPLTGAARDHVFMAPRDAQRLGLRHQQPVRIHNELGEFRGRLFLAEVALGTLQAHWPEVNGLVPHGIVDAGGGVPDYNADVSVEAI